MTLINFRLKNYLNDKMFVNSFCYIRKQKYFLILFIFLIPFMSLHTSIKNTSESFILRLYWSDYKITWGIGWLVLWLKPIVYQRIWACGVSAIRGGSFYRILVRIYASFGKNHEKLPATKSTGYWNRHLSSTSFENTTSQPLVKHIRN